MNKTDEERIRGMLEYFSEWLESKEMTADVFIRARRAIIGKNYQGFMQEVRRVLREVYKVKDIPFNATYRRNFK